jgi:hypothetical protein
MVSRAANAEDGKRTDTESPLAGEGAGMAAPSAHTARLIAAIMLTKKLPLAITCITQSSPPAKWRLGAGMIVVRNACLLRLSEL